MFARLFTAAVLLLAAVWGAWPYGSLWLFGKAVDADDPARIEDKVDWQSVRDHLKDDVWQRLSAELEKEGEGGEEGEALARSALMLLATAIAQGLIETYATPEALLAVLNGIAKAGEDDGDFLNTVSYAFFAAPTRFRVHVKPEGAEGKPLVLTFTFQDFGWVVTRIGFPLDDLNEGNGKQEDVKPRRGPRDQER